jgi:alpha-mannosidase
MFIPLFSTLFNGIQFADLSEYGYGVAILSESKYGFSCQGHVLSISLLRAATAPDAEQDQGLLLLTCSDIHTYDISGEHTFSWAVMPHEGHFLESDVLIAAYLYNSPLRCQFFLALDLHVVLITNSVRSVSGETDAMLFNLKSPFVVEGARNVFLETIKRGDGDFGNTSKSTTVILRLYEAFGGYTQARLKISGHLPVARAYTTNLLEDEDEANELNIMRGAGEAAFATLKLDFRAFEVKTVKLVLHDSHVPFSHQQSVSFPS